MKIYQNYVNNKTELELIKLNIENINKKEEYLKNLKREYLQMENELQLMNEQVENVMHELEGIEQELIYEILVKGKNVTRAVDVIAFKYDLDTSTIWKNYYPKVKEKLKSLQVI